MSFSSRQQAGLEDDSERYGWPAGKKIEARKNPGLDV
jgi:hypothetical protein